MVSAGFSTAVFAPLPPYGAYVDIHGREHQGTDHGEIFKSPPPPPAPYQKGRFRAAWVSNSSSAPGAAPWLTSAATPAASRAR
jgi:hypothetical protein